MILDFLFKGDYHYELLHKLALGRLLEHEEFAAALLGLKGTPDVVLEPENGKFDIRIRASNRDYYLELKTGSQLSEGQKNGQSSFVSNNSAQLGYVVLGTSSLLYRDVDIQRISGGKARRYSYKEIQDALKHCIDQWEATAIHSMFAKEYSATLEAYQDDINKGWKECSNTKLHHVELYQCIKAANPDIPLELKILNNSKPQVLLTLGGGWEKVTIRNQQVHLYFEFVDGKLRFKFKINSELLKNEAWREVRKNVRESCRSVFGKLVAIEIADTGRKGEHMTACETVIDYGEDGYALDHVNTILPIVYSGMPQWRRELERYMS